MLEVWISGCASIQVAVFYILVLGKFNLSVAYPVVIDLTVVATMITGAVILKKKVSVGDWAGVGLMLSGICAIAFGSLSSLT